jgi:ABC-2 type transport system permease protein
MSAATAGLSPLYLRRLAVTGKTVARLVAQLLTPVLWILIVGPALARALGSFSPSVDYYTYVAVGQVAFLVPFTAMFAGIDLLTDKDLGILRELLVAPIRRAIIPLANAAAVALLQVALVVGLAVARGAHFHTSLARLPWFVATAALLSLGMYGIAQILALAINQQAAYGALIPAIGVTPFFLSGAMYPLSVLPIGLKATALVLPWTHAVALLHYGMMQGTDPGLAAIWHLPSEPLMATLSLATLAVFAVASLAIAVRMFSRSTSDDVP